MGERLKKFFMKKIYSWQKQAHEKMPSIITYLGKLKFKQQWDITLHLLELLNLKILTITSVGEDAEKLELLYTCWWEYKVVQLFWKRLAISWTVKPIPFLWSSHSTHRYLSYRNTRASVQNRMNVDSSIDYGEVFMSRKYEIIVTFCLKCIYFIIRN